MQKFRHGHLAKVAKLVGGGAALSLASWSAYANLTFLGVASGDASSTEAIVWTRALDGAAPASAALTVQFTSDQTFASGVSSIAASTDAAADYTCKVDLNHLQPATRYYYRFVGPNSELSITGTFKTAPGSAANAAVRFAFSGDMDGLMRPYALASTVPAQNLDFYVNIGDTIYETASKVGGLSAAPNNSPKTKDTGALPAPSSTGATASQLFTDFSRKYREQFLPVNAGGQNGLQSFYAGQGNYTLYDNHELGNKQYINGGAPAGGPIGDGTVAGTMPSGAGVDARQGANDVTPATGPFMNKSLGFQTLERVFLNYQPMKERGLISAASDLRTDGTPQLYFAQQWGRNAIFVNTDARSYRDIRVKTAGNADDTTAPRANNPSRTYLGATQLAWLEQTLLDAESVGTPWKFVTTSDPIDQIGPIGGALTGIVNTSGNTANYSPVNADGGKSWMGGYRAERNALLKFIADHQIKNVVFLTTDDHQNRVNELTYSPSGQTEVQSSYKKVPYCFQIVCGPLGATGPDLFLNHDFSSIKTIADSFVTAQQAAGIEPFGLQGYPGLHNVAREGDPNANSSPSAVDFYSPDTFNYNTLEVSADGKTLTVKSIGITSTAQNSGLEYGANGNTVRQIFSFQIDAPTPLNDIDHIVVIYQENWSFDALYGSFPGANGIANASAASLNQLDRLTGNPLSTETGSNTYNNPSKNPNLPNQNPPVPLNGTQDKRFLTNPADTNSPTLVNTLLPYSLTGPPLNLQPTALTGDIVHRYWTEALQINDGNNNKFITWSDNPGLVMSHFDASNLPEGLLAQQYTMCDNFFHSAFGGSFLNHQFLIAAAPPVFPNAASLIPNSVTTLAADGSLALNSNGKIIRDGFITPIGGQVYNFTPGTSFDQNYAVNTAFSKNLAPTFNTVTTATLVPSLTGQTIGDILDNAGIHWKWYSGGWNNALDSSPANPLHFGVNGSSVSSLFQWHHQAFAYFEKYKPFDGTQTDGRNPVSALHLQDEANLYTDIANNTLPAVSFVKFLGPDNEHPGYAALQQGQQHVADLVAAVQAHPALWAHTAIIITYDEHGGRWDHVPPPVRDIWGPGVRVPAIVISPFAKQGFVDHTERDTSAILATIEQRFGLPSLNERDGEAPSFANVLTTLRLTRGGFSFDRRLNRFTQLISVANQGSIPVIGPITLALDHLSPNTSLANAAGVTANNAPDGSPFVTLAAGDLAPGASASVVLQFTKPASGGITYNARTVSGTANP